jgi:hypothetical protein
VTAMQVIEPINELSVDAAPSSPVEQRLDRWLAADGRGLRTAVAALCLILAACGTALWLGLPHAAIYGHDTFIQIDGGWRVLHGQRPHVDFYSAFGPVPYLISAAGLASAGSNVEGLVNATAAVGLLLGMWAWMLVRNRLKAWAALLFLLLVLSLWLAPFPLGEPFYMTGYAMQYNRLGYVLACLILVDLYAPSQRAGLRFDIGGFSTGVAVALLLFTKVSCFFAACALIASAYFLAGKTRRHFFSVAAGFALAAVPMLAYLHWDLPAMAHDLLIAAAARKTRFLEGYDPFRSFFRNLESIAALLGMAFLATRSARGRKVPRVFGFVCVVLAVDFAMAMANTQRYGFPVALAAIVILASRVREPGLRPAAALVAMVAVLPALSGAANGWGMVLRTNVLAKSLVHAPQFDAPHLAGLIFEDHNEPGIDPASHNGALYVSQVNEGLALLRAASRSEERIACLWFANPFSYALLRPSPTGGSPFWAYGVNLTEASAPDPRRILGNADLVMQPRNVADSAETSTLLAIAGSELKARYRIAAQSEHWVLWRHL